MSFGAETASSPGGSNEGRSVLAASAEGQNWMATRPEVGIANGIEGEAVRLASVVDELSARVEHRERLLRSLQTAARMAMTELDTRELAASFARVATLVSAAGKAIFCSKEPDGLVLRGSFPEGCGEELFGSYRYLLNRSLQRRRAHLHCSIKDHSKGESAAQAEWGPGDSDSVLVVPIIDHQRQVIGLIAMQDPLHPDGFHDADIQAVETLVLQYSTALSRSKLFDSLQDWTQSLEMLLAFNTAINQHLEPAELVNRLVENATRFLKADGGMAGFTIPSEKRGEQVMSSEAYFHRGQWHGFHRRWAAKEGVPGYVLETEFVYLSNNYAADPAADPELIECFDLQKILCVPIKDVSGKMIGFFALHKGEGSTPFTWQDAAFLETLGNSTAVAIQNAQLLKTLEVKNREIRVLSAGHVRHLEDERRHIARELHDEAGQMLVGIKLGLQVLARKVTSTHPELTQELDRLRGLINQSSTQLRDLARNLRPPTLDKLGVDMAIRQLASEHEQRSGIKISLSFDPLPEIVPEPVRTALYRIVQEALTNVAKHAEAARVVIELRTTVSSLTLSITDDGCGFDPAVSNSGLGLLGMKERAGMLGGQLTVRSRNGKGTEICLWMPL